MSNYFRIVLIVLFLFSCQKKEEIKIVGTKMANETLHGSIKFPVITELALDILEIDSLLVIVTPFSRNEIFKVFSKISGQEKFSFIKRGHGPDEYLQPVIYKTDRNILTLWDSNNIFSEICLQQNENGELICNLLSQHKLKQGGTQVFRFNHDLLISTIHPKGMFAFFNEKGEVVGNYFGKNPLNVSGIYDRFQGQIAVTNKQDGFIFGTYNLGYLCAYEIIDVNNPILKWEYYIQQKPYYKLEKGNFKWDKQKHVQGIKGIQIHKEKILVLYSGRSASLPGNDPKGAFSDNLILFNMDGEILKKFKLDTSVLKCHYSEKDSALYGITITDDWRIVKFQNINI
jgi:hypothetical protein